MKPIPIHVIVAGMRRMSLPEQVHYLRDWVKQEPLYSVRRNELESLLRGKLAKQLRREVAA